MLVSAALVCLLGIPTASGDVYTGSSQTGWIFNATSIVSLNGVTSNPLAVVILPPHAAVVSAGTTNQLNFYQFNASANALASAPFFSTSGAYTGPAQVQLVRGNCSNVTVALATLPGIQSLYAFQLNGTIVTQVAVVPMAFLTRTLVLDPNYPWLYAVGQTGASLFDITNVTNPTLVNTLSLGTSILPTGSVAAVVNGSQLLVADASGQSNGLVVIDYTSASATTAPSVSRLSGLTKWGLRSLFVSPLGNLYGAMRDVSETVGTPFGSLLSQWGANETSLLPSIVPDNPGVDMTPIGPYLFILSQPQTANLTMISVYRCPALVLSGSAPACDGYTQYLVLPYGTHSMVPNSWSWYQNRLFIASVANNSIYSLQVDSTDSQISIPDLVSNLAKTRAGNFSLGALARMPALQLVQSESLLIDAAAVAPITTGMLQVTDMVKNLDYNNVTFSVPASFNGGDQFQLFNGVSQVWSTVTSFSQSQVNNALVRLLPNSAFRTTCASSGATGYQARVALNLSDRWGRLLSLPSLAYAVACCTASTNLTVAPAQLVPASLDGGNVANSSINGFCSRAIQGLYTDINSINRPCPMGTYNPFYGAGDGSTVCLSCPQNSTTVAAGSTSLSQCASNTLQTVLSGSSNGNTVVYYWPPSGSISSPTPNISIFYTVTVRGTGPAYIALSTSPLATVNNTAITSSTYTTFQLAAGESGNSVLAATNQTVALGGGIMGASNLTTTPAWRVVSPDVWTTLWVAYSNGVLRMGVLDPSLTATNLSATSQSALALVARGAFTNISQSLSSPVLSATFSNASTLAITRIGLGFLSSSTLQYTSGLLYASNDLFANFITVAPQPALQLSASFPTVLDSAFLYTLIPGSSFNVTWTNGAVNATWFDPVATTYDFTNNPGVLGTSFEMYVTDGSLNQSLWQIQRTFTGDMLAANRVYLKALVPQAAITQSPITLTFTANNSLIQVPTTRTSQLLISLVPLASGYSLHIGAWRKESAAAMPALSDRCNPAVMALGGAIYVFGGAKSDGSVSFNDLWSYSLSQMSWTSLAAGGAALPSNRSLITFAPIGADGLAFYGGYGAVDAGQGAGASVIKSDTWLYNMTTGNFSLMSPACSGSGSLACPPAKANYGQLMTTGNPGSPQMWMFGGATQSADSNELFALDWTRQTWSFVNSQSARNASAAVSFCTALLVADPSNIPAGRQMHASAVDGAQGLLVFGGQHLFNSDNLLNDLWRFDSIGGMWTQLVRPIDSSLLVNLQPFAFGDPTVFGPAPRNQSSGVSDGFGNFYVYGGQSNNGALRNDLWLFNQNLNQWMLLSGSGDAASPQSTPFSAALNVSSSLNRVPASSGNRLVLVPRSADGRRYALYLYNGCQAGSAEVWSMEVYIPVSVPVLALADTRLGNINFATTQYLVINSTLFNVTVYDVTRSQVTITPSTSFGYFVDLVTRATLTSWTLQDMVSGNPIAFYPNLTALVQSSAVGGSTSASGNVTFVVQSATGASSQISASLYAACTQPNTVLPSCASCSTGYTMDSNGVCQTTQSQSAASSSSSMSIIIIASAAGGGALIVIAMVGAVVYTRAARKRRAAKASESTMASQTTGATGAYVAEVPLPAALPSSSHMIGQALNMGVASSNPSAGTGTYGQGASAYSTMSGMYGPTVQQGALGYPSNAYGNQAAVAMAAYAAAANQAVMYPTQANMAAAYAAYGAASLAANNASNAKGMGMQPRGQPVAAAGYAGVAPFMGSNMLHGMGARLPGAPAEGQPTNQTAGSNMSPEELEYSMRTQVVSSRPIIAFPAFLAVNSSSGLRKISKIAEGGFAVLYKGQLLDQTIAEGAYKDQYVAMKSFKFRTPKNRPREGQPSDTQHEPATSASPTDGVLPPSADAIADMENEASVMYALQNCPNVVKLIAVSKEPELMLAMRLYLESVAHLIHSSHSRHYGRALQFARGSHPRLGMIFSYDLCSAILAMHAIGIVHLDVKPSNLLIESVKPDSNITGFPYRAVLCDFGLARVVSETNAVKGRRRTFATGVSINYAAPEAFSLVRFMDAGSTLGADALQKLDIYSVAASLYEIMVREVPFEGKTLAQLEEILARGERPLMHYFVPTGAPLPVTAGLGVNQASMLSLPGAPRDTSTRPASQQEAYQRNIQALLAAHPPKFAITCPRDISCLVDMARIIMGGWAQFSDARPTIGQMYDEVCGAMRRYATESGPMG